MKNTNKTVIIIPPNQMWYNISSPYHFARLPATSNPCPHPDSDQLSKLIGKAPVFDW